MTLNIFKNFNISKRIFLGAGVLVILIFVQGFFAMNSINLINQKTSEIEKDWLPSGIYLGGIDAGLF